MRVARIVVIAAAIVLSTQFAWAEETNDGWRLCRLDDERPKCEAKFSAGPAYQGAGDTDGATGESAGDAGAATSGGNSGASGEGDGCGPR